MMIWFLSKYVGPLFLANILRRDFQVDSISEFLPYDISHNIGETSAAQTKHKKLLRKSISYFVCKLPTAANSIMMKTEITGCHYYIKSPILSME
jgi:hypothetical protein